MTDLETTIATERRLGAEALERGDERAARIHYSNAHWMESFQGESEAPSTWVDESGVSRRVPTTRGRLNFGLPSHRAIRKFVMERDHFSCQDCGIAADRTPEEYDGSFAPRIRGGDRYLVIDHICSKHAGGDGYTHHPSNLQTLCDGCNARKRNLVDIRAESL